MDDNSITQPAEYARLQADNIDQVEKILRNFKKDGESRKTNNYFIQRLRQLQDLSKEFINYHRVILLSNLTSDDDYYKKDIFSKFDEKHSAAYAYIESQYEMSFPEQFDTTNNRQTNVNDGNNRNTPAIVKLPQLPVPKFSGKYVDWQSFHDQFLRLIHNHTGLSNIERFRYLREALPEDFDDDIRNLEFTDANYTTAWKNLNTRYNNKRVMFTHYMNKFTSIEKIREESSIEFKLLKDTAYACINGLASLGISSEHCSSIYVHFLVSKLPKFSHQLWEQELGATTDIPVYDKFHIFIDTRFRTLESWELLSHQNNSKLSDHKKSSSQPNKHTPSNTSFKKDSKYNHAAMKPDSDSQPIQCSVCKGAHILRRCPDFLKMDCFDRKNHVEKIKSCYNCLSNTHTLPTCTSTRNCNQCGRRHHSLLHLPNKAQVSTNGNNNPSASSLPTPSNISNNHIGFHHATINELNDFPCPTEVLLPTAIVKVFNQEGHPILLRALIDQGSQGALITERAAQTIKSKRFPITSNVNFPTGLKANGLSVTPITVQSCVDSSFQLNVLACITKSVTSDLPNKTFQRYNWSHLRHLKLADPAFHRSRAIDLLLGANVYGRALKLGVVKGKDDEPIAQETAFGWIVSGDVFKSKSSEEIMENPSFNCSHITMPLDQLVHNFFELENVPKENEITLEEQWCEEYFQKTTVRQPNGKYLVRLPLKHLYEPTITLGKSRQMALNRFHSMERKLAKNENLREQYHTTIDGYFQLNQLKPAITSEHQHITINKENHHPTYSCFTLPHHSIMKPSSKTTKCRVVFDASAKSSNGHSLNDILFPGPPLQNDLPAVLLNWRLHRFVFTADIEKMYRCIDLHENDINYQRFLWRNENHEIRDYCLTTVTFGVNVSPFLALRVIQQLAEDERRNFPLAEIPLKKELYIDDDYSGSDTISNALEKRNQIIGALRSGGFELRKWASNTIKLLDSIPTEHLSNASALNFNNDQTIKTLGMCWKPNADQFTFQIDFNIAECKMTKRSVLSVVAKLYDPNGLINPVIAKAKIFLKSIWLAKLDWDDELPMDLRSEWQDFLKELPVLHNVAIPRWLQFSPTDTKRFELHAFCDGSLQAYAALVYLRIQTNKNEFHTNIIAAKSKVTPVNKIISVPRIELCAAALNVKLVNWVLKHIQLNTTDLPIYYWTDATIVLSWIRGDFSRWPIFVKNRIATICASSNKDQWHHVTTNENPADVSSRGLTPTQLLQSQLFWNGPSWLETSEENWPKSDWTFLDNEETMNVSNIQIHTNTQESTNFIETFSSYDQLLRIVAWILRFRHNAKFKILEHRTFGLITVEELHKSLVQLVFIVQHEKFGSELCAIKNKRPLSNKSKLIGLTPFIDQHGILRVLGRLQHSNLSYNEKHPMILPSQHHFTNLLIECCHQRTLHGGTQITSAYLRKQGFWIIHTRRTVGNKIKKCVKCFRTNPTTTTQLMGNLPVHRINPPNRAFLAVGIDCAGPIELRASRYRGNTTYKGYIVIFVCLATKAIHLEAVTGMSTKDFLKALQRFIGRRGLCHDIYSDNGTNFVGANKMLKQELIDYQTGIKKDIIPVLTNHGIHWHFIPPLSPNFGGLWESNIRSVKYHLKRVTVDSFLTYENLTTLLIRIESCLNSRPLCPLTSDPEDLFVLTPGHFIIGDALNAPPQSYVHEMSPICQYLNIQRKLQQFWSFWSQHWLSHLQNRPKWQKAEANLQLNDMIIIKEDHVPPNQWILGRIIELHPGTDNIVRVVTVKTAKGNYKRSVSKICKLPIQATSTETISNAP